MRHRDVLARALGLAPQIFGSVLQVVEALIVSYNSRHEIEECLDAVRVAGIQAAVLDNLSTDGTAEFIADRYPWVRLVRSQTNLGFGGGTNELAFTSDAEFVLLLNPDAVIAPDTPRELQSALEADSRAIAAGPKLIYPDGERQPSNQRLPDFRFELAGVLAGTRFSQCWRWDGIAHADRVMGWSWNGDGSTERTDVLWATCWIIRSQDIRSYGLFDPAFPMYDEDLDFCARMTKLGRHFLYVPSTTVVHYGGASSTDDHKKRLARRARHVFYRRHRGRAYAALVRRTAVAIERVIRTARAKASQGPETPNV